MKKDQRELLNEARDGQEYWARLATMEFVQGLLQLMREDGVSRSELARRYKTKPPYVTKVLSGSENHTLDTMQRFAEALGASIHVAVVRKDEWFYFQTEKKSSEPVALGERAEKSSTVTSSDTATPDNLLYYRQPKEASAVQATVLTGSSVQNG